MHKLLPAGKVFKSYYIINICSVLKILFRVTSNHFQGKNATHIRLLLHTCFSGLTKVLISALSLTLHLYLRLFSYFLYIVSTQLTVVKSYSKASLVADIISINKILMGSSTSRFGGGVDVQCPTFSCNMLPQHVYQQLTPYS